MAGLSCGLKFSHTAVYVPLCIRGTPCPGGVIRAFEAGFRLTVIDELQQPRPDLA